MIENSSSFYSKSAAIDDINTALSATTLPSELKTRALASLKPPVFLGFFAEFVLPVLDLRQRYLTKVIDSLEESESRLQKEITALNNELREAKEEMSAASSCCNNEEDPTASQMQVDRFLKHMNQATDLSSRIVALKNRLSGITISLKEAKGSNDKMKEAHKIIREAAQHFMGSCYESFS